MTYSAHILHILSSQKIRSKNSHTFLSFFFLAWKRRKLPGKWANCEDGCFMCKCHTYHRDYVINDRKHKHGTEWEEVYSGRKVWFENWIQLFCFYWSLLMQKIPAWRMKLGYSVSTSNVMRIQISARESKRASILHTGHFEKWIKN